MAVNDKKTKMAKNGTIWMKLNKIVKMAKIWAKIERKKELKVRKIQEREGTGLKKKQKKEKRKKKRKGRESHQMSQKQVHQFKRSYHRALLPGLNSSYFSVMVCIIA